MRKLAMLVVACAIASHTSAHANVVQRADVDRLRFLLQKAQDLNSSVSQAAESAFNALAQNPDAVARMGGSNITALDACLSRLSLQAGHVESFLALIWKEAGLASLMRERVDEATVLGFVRVELNSITQDYNPLARRVANEVSGMCQGSALVVAKAQSLLELIGEIENTITPLSRRIGPISR